MGPTTNNSNYLLYVLYIFWSMERDLFIIFALHLIISTRILDSGCALCNAELLLPNELSAFAFAHAETR